MNLFNRKKAVNESGGAFSAGRQVFRPASSWGVLENELYEQLRAQVPVIDACFGKIVRLTNDFRLVGESKAAQKYLDRFSREVSVGLSGRSVGCFADLYLDTLLTYGRALGEISADVKRRQVRGLYVADPDMFKVRRGKSPLEMKIVDARTLEEVRMSSPERVFYTTLNPSVKHPDGVSILRGIPALSGVLMRIYECIGQNFDRVGNVRYAVTYKPSAESGEKAFARERALEIAREWSDGMVSSKNGVVKDFVAVGDVDIKVIGADNQVIDTEVPVRQILEQIVAKLSIPPFLLGLNWSSTERMSSQQADILTSELEYYRRLLTPVLIQIGSAALRLGGFSEECSVEWSAINLQDEESMARAELYRAQAEEIKKQNAADGSGVGGN